MKLTIKFLFLGYHLRVYLTAVEQFNSHLEYLHSRRVEQLPSQVVCN